MVYLITILIAALLLTFLVTIHELGHFLLAKFFKVKVEEFAIGFPPRLWGKKKGETLYSVNAIPAGGFVRLYGEEGESAGDPRSFAHQGPWPRAAIIVAGVVMNLLLAFILFTVLLASNNFRSDFLLSLPASNKNISLHFPLGQQIDRPLVTFIEEGSPAEKAGLKALDQVQSADGVSFSSIKEFQSFIKANSGTSVDLRVYNIFERNTRSVQVTPRVNPPEGQGALGVGLGESTSVLYSSPLEKIFVGPLHSVNTIYYQFKGIASIFSQAVEEKSAAPVTTTVSGPIGIVAVISSFLGLTGTSGLYMVLDLVALLSLILAIMNVLPIPALDGGRLFFAVFEGVTGLKVNKTVERWIHTVGFAVLILLFFLITFNDLVRIFGR